MWRVFNLIACLMVLAWAGSLSGCGRVSDAVVDTVDWAGNYWEPSIGTQEFTTDAPVERNQPSILLHPTNTPGSPLTALAYPMRVTQPISNPVVLGRALGRVFWQTWSQAKVFPTLIYEEEAEWPGLARALAAARARDVDLVIRGEIPYYLDGGSKGSSSVSLRVEIFDVEAGQRVWLLEHAGRMEPQPRRDYIVAYHNRRMPESPIFSIMTLISCDLAMYVGHWNNGWDEVRSCK